MGQITEKKKKFLIPHTYAIIFSIIIIATLATYFLPAGQYERMEEAGRTIVVENSYAQVEQSPVSIFEMFKAIPLGMQAGARIIFYIFLVGGAFGIIRATGAIESGVNALVQKMQGSGIWLIPISMTVFSILGFSTGMSEETIIFVPIGIAIARALGYDALVGTAMVSTGAASGFIGGMLNPFTVGIAQEIAEVKLFSGIGFRSVVYVFILLIAITYVMRYAKKIQADPTKSIMYDIEQKIKLVKVSDIDTFDKFTTRHILVLLTLLTGILVNMYGVFKLDWFLDELAANFIIVGFVAGILGGLNINKLFDALVDGMKIVAFGALIVGFARAILVVLESGVIIDTIVYSLVQLISHLPQTLNAVGMFGVQVIINFFIPSGSGQAATTMPIMVPIADLLGMERQIAVLAFQYGDAITNSIIPTSAALMGYLAIAGIPYERWVKFIWKLIVIWLIIAAIALVAAVMLGVS
ncbi:Na+/H+ antiporter NhaC family protein [Metasolibacillus sp.]|uniref:YfcC family protein n=1 Tax=Metasolibacillus sp. TaxID=2703680 RepID=UPI0025D82597|nr:Na+/H+ antiporter NhaC family protein [Metasolibacillus sp.]MCT6925156.1 TIGR00366 family protein [Metasolibacillus sp.]MCT6941373.1 TIGR00366 family protein [Metasolibacillus sp.]